MTWRTLFVGLSVGLVLSGQRLAAADAADAETNNVSSEPVIVVVVGAAGEPEYGELFGHWADRWTSAAEDFEVPCHVVAPTETDGGTAECKQKAAVQTAIADAIEAKPPSLWLVLIGHGTFDGQSARFNLCGDDISAQELTASLAERTAPTVVFNCTSASAPFINRLSGPNRIVVTATKNGGELQFARFGQFLSESLLAPSTDLDKDGAASALELALEASRRTQAWYVAEGRIATEHALVDDNGDRRGTRTDLFDGFRIAADAVKTGDPDGSLARSLTLFRVAETKELTQDEMALQARLEAEIDAIRSARDGQEPSEVALAKLETIFVRLAPLYVDVEKKPSADGAGDRDGSDSADRPSEPEPENRGDPQDAE